MNKTLPVFLAASFAVSMFAMSSVAFAQPDNPNCWGTVTSQRAVAEGDIGEHSSAQDEPRAGLGNVARLFGFNHVSELGTFLASIDGIDETSCP